MHYPRYEFEAEDELFYFEFVSEGRNGRIKKIVEFSKMNVENFYNLGFGDYDEQTGTISDKTVTNNGDAFKVLATVSAIAYAFTSQYPEAWIFATGSSDVRTRLYRMGISNNLAEINKDFHVYGLIENGNFEEFIVGEDYFGFLVKRRK